MSFQLSKVKYDKYITLHKAKSNSIKITILKTFQEIVLF